MMGPDHRVGKTVLYRSNDGTNVVSPATVYRTRTSTLAGWRRPQEVFTLPDDETVDLLVHSSAADHWLYHVPAGDGPGRWTWPEMSPRALEAGRWPWPGTSTTRPGGQRVNLDVEGTVSTLPASATTIGPNHRATARTSPGSTAGPRWYTVSATATGTHLLSLRRGRPGGSDRRRCRPAAIGSLLSSFSGGGAR